MTDFAEHSIAIHRLMKKATEHEREKRYIEAIDTLADVERHLHKAINCTIDKKYG